MIGRMPVIFLLKITFSLAFFVEKFSCFAKTSQNSLQGKQGQALNIKLTKDKGGINLNVKHFMEDRLLVFEVTEELDHHSVEIIRRRADYEIQRFMPKRVVFDFNRVVFMDSAGIGLVIGRYKTVNGFGGKLEMMNVKDNLRRVFEMSGILKMIPVIDSLEKEKIS